MQQPTDIINLSDITEITGVADVIIDRALLWVAPGRTPAGRFWALFTPDHILAGVVAERKDGSFAPVIGTRCAHTTTAQAAALAIVAALRGAA